MSVKETSGVAALARILSELAQGETPTAAELGARTGVSRSTAFDIVSRLSKAGFVGRDIEGAVMTGPSAAALGFAAFRMAALAGPAETLLHWLHERSDAFVEFAAGDTVLLSLGKSQTDIALEAPIRDRDGEIRARLRLAWRVHTSQAERQRIAADFERVRISLELYLHQEGTGA